MQHQPWPQRIASVTRAGRTCVGGMPRFIWGANTWRWTLIWHALYLVRLCLIQRLPGCHVVALVGPTSHGTGEGKSIVPGYLQA